MRRRVTILGATGSVGKNALEVVGSNPEQYEIVALTAHQNVHALAQAARKMRASCAVIRDDNLYDELKSLLAGSGVEAMAGENAILEAVGRPCECVIVAIIGMAALLAVREALKQGIILGIANKETLVAAGHLVKKMASKYNSQLIPVDSEHSAIYQLFDQAQRHALQSLILTASGGPFLRYSQDQLKKVTPQEAVKHPNWAMGAKISVDSASMMNKALELIEACHLFEVDEHQLEVVIHPSSIVHSMVRYKDGSLLAHMGTPDMKTPIAYALSYPRRMVTNVAPLDFSKGVALHFEALDEAQFKAIPLARAAYKKGGHASIALNAANEMAVAAFLEKKIAFTDIIPITARVVAKSERGHAASWQDIIESDKWARHEACQYIADILTK